MWILLLYLPEASLVEWQCGLFQVNATTQTLTPTGLSGPMAVFDF